MLTVNKCFSVVKCVNTRRSIEHNHKYPPHPKKRHTESKHMPKAAFLRLTYLTNISLVDIRTYLPRRGNGAPAQILAICPFPTKCRQTRRKSKESPMLANLSSRNLKCLPNEPVVETITTIHCAICTVKNYLRICQIHQLWECEKSAVTGVALKAL